MEANDMGRSVGPTFDPNPDPVSDEDAARMAELIEELNGNPAFVEMIEGLDEGSPPCMSFQISTGVARVIHDPFDLCAEQTVHLGEAKPGNFNPLDMIPDDEWGHGPSFLTLTAAAILGEVEKMVRHISDRRRQKGK